MTTKNSSPSAQRIRNTKSTNQQLKYPLLTSAIAVMFFMTCNPVLAINPQSKSGTPDPYFSQSTNTENRPDRFADRSSSWAAPITPSSSDSQDKRLTPFQPSAQQLKPLTSTPGTVAPKRMEKPAASNAVMQPIATDDGPRNLLAPFNSKSDNNFSNTLNRLRSPQDSGSIIRQVSPATPSNQFGSAEPPVQTSPSEFTMNMGGVQGRRRGPQKIQNQFATQAPSSANNSFESSNENFDQQPTIKVHSSEVLVNDGTKPISELTDVTKDQWSGRVSTQRSESVAKKNPVASPVDNRLSSSQATTSVATDSKPKSGKEFKPGQVLALVGGDPIFVGDVLYQVNQLLERLPPDAPDDVRAQLRETMIQRLLPQFVENKLLYIGSIRNLPDGVDIDNVLGQAEKEFDEKAIGDIMKEAGVKSVAQFDAKLRLQGSSLRKLRRTWSEEQLTRFFLSQQLKSDTEVTHQEMLKSYRDNLADYATPAKSRWEQVMIRFDKASSREEAKKQVVELGNKIVYGGKLPAVAKKWSHGFQASNGGQHDWTTKGALVLKELDKAIFTLPIGDLSDIIETRDGFHIVRVLERNEATHKPFLDAQVEIKERILGEKRQQAYKAYLEKLKDEIPVEYLIGTGSETEAPLTAANN